jgi:hypothetical protein
MVRNAKRSGRMTNGTMRGYRPVVSKFGDIPSLPDLDLRTSEYIYFLESDTPFKLIKIGRTESLKRRLMGLQTMCPVQLRLIGAIRAPAGTENLLHAILSNARAHGEWFFPTSELIDLIKQLPKMGTLTHAEVRELCAARGCDELQITRAFSRPSKKAKRPCLRYGQVVLR